MAYEYILEQYNNYIAAIVPTFKEAKELMAHNKCGTITKTLCKKGETTEIKRWAYLTTGELVEVPLYDKKYLLTE